MPFRDAQTLLRDVVEAIDEFTENMDLGAYSADDKTKAAVERKIQILTEAIIRLEDQDPGAYPEIDQKAYRGMGNLIRHSYHRVDDSIVWRTIREDLPQLRDIARNLLERFHSVIAVRLFSVWGGWWDLNPRHPEPQSGATTN